MADFSLRKYDLIKKIGEGGICDVWQIRRRSDDYILALKKLKSSAPENVQALKSEYEFLAFHKHPGLPSVYEYLQYGDDISFVLDYLPGDTLESECGSLSVDRLKARMLDILEIACFVSQSGYIYNDYKPQNFIVGPDSKLTLIDFNLIQNAEITTNQKSGTFGYIAPELLTGNSASPQTDIYSLGATFYELACNKAPFTAPDEGALIKLITETIPEPPNSGSELLDSVIMRMLEKEPKNRYNEIIDVIESLDESDRFNRLMMANKEHYIQAGIWPFTREIIARLSGSKPSPVMAITLNEYESAKLYDNTLTLARTNFNNVITSAIDDLAVVDNDENELISDSSSLFIINCHGYFTQDIALAIKSIAARETRGSQVLFITSSPNLNSENTNVTVMSLRDIAKRTEIFINHYLGKNSLSENICEQLEILTGGDPELLYLYTLDLIDRDIIRYTTEGWEDTDNLSEDEIPESIVCICNQVKTEFSPEQSEIINILSVTNEPQPAGIVETLGGFDKGQNLSNLSHLCNRGILEFKNSLYNISGRARKISFYSLIDGECRRDYHKRFYDYYNQTNTDYDQRAYHAYHAGCPQEALELGYRAADHRLKEFNLKAARNNIQIAEKAFSCLTETGSIIDLAVRVFNLAGDIAKVLAENTDAITKYLKAAELAKLSPNANLLADSYKNLADINRVQQRPAESIEYARKALPIYRSLNDLPHQAACYNNIGLAHWTAGEHDAALENFAQSLAINQELGDLTEQSKIYNNIAIVNDITGRKDKALAGFKQAIDCVIRTKNPQLESRYLDNLGFFFLSSGQSQESLEYFHKSYKLATEIGYADGQLSVISNLAQAYYKMGDIMKSAESNQKAMEIAGNLNHTRFQMQAGGLLARDCLALGNFKLAQKMIDVADSIAVNLVNPEIANDLQLLKAEFYYNVGDFSAGEDIFYSMEASGKLNHNQKIQCNYLKLRYALIAEKPFREIENLASSVIENNLREYTGAALVVYASALLEKDDIAGAQSALERYQTLNIEDILIEFDHKVVLAKFLAVKRAYDEALELLVGMEKDARESGCLPIYMNILTAHIGVLESCGKEAMLKQLIEHLISLAETVAESIPENLPVEIFLRSPILKSTLAIADKYGVPIKFRDESSQKWKTA